MSFMDFSKNKSSMFWLTFALILLQLYAEIDATCVCNAKGVDYCQSCTKSRIVRPKVKYYPPDPLALPPIGDNCWCSKMLVEPAPLPPPSVCPKQKTPVCTCKLPGYAPTPALPLPAPLPFPAPYGAAHLPLLPSALPLPIPIDNSPPADPISISLAVQAGKAIAVPEAKLAYGFVQKPIDGLKKIYFSSVPEENLFALKNEIITLKKKPLPPPKEEDLIDLEEEDELPADVDEIPALTYKQLGYAPEVFKNPRFARLRARNLLARRGCAKRIPASCAYRAAY